MTAAGCIAAAVSIAAIALTGPDTPYAAFVLPYLLFGAGFAAITPSLATMAMAAVESGRSGLAAGIVNAARQMGTVLGIAAIGSAAVIVAERSWNNRAGSSADDLGQTVAGGQVAEVTAKLGARLGRRRRRCVHDRHARRDGARRAGARRQCRGDPCRIPANASSARSRAPR